MTQGLLGFNEVPIGAQFDVQTTTQGVYSGTVVDPTSLVALSTLFAQNKFVAKNGNDATGDGSVTKPFLTIQAAISSISDASSAKPYSVTVFAGVYTDTFAVAPWIYVQGISPLSVFLNPTTANWISAGFAAGTQDGGINNVTLLTNVTVDFSLVASTGTGTFKLFNCLLGTAVALLFKGNNAANTVLLNNLFATGPSNATLTLTNISSRGNSITLLNGAVTIASTDAYATLHRLGAFSTSGAVSVTWTGAVIANFLQVIFWDSPLTFSPSSLTITGTAAIVTTHGLIQANGPDANTTFSFGKGANNLGTIIFPQNADNIIIANPTAPRTYTFEGGGSVGTRFRIVNQSNFPITVAYTSGASGNFPSVIEPRNTAQFYAASSLLWTSFDYPTQGGTAVALTNGQSALIPADLTAVSAIVVTLNTPNGAGGVPCARAADRVLGFRSGGSGFKITSVALATGIQVATDQGTYDWHVVD